MRHTVKVVLDRCLGIILTGRWVGASIKRREEPILRLAHALANRSRVQTANDLLVVEKVWRHIGAGTRQKSLLGTHVLAIGWL